MPAPAAGPTARRNAPRGQDQGGQGGAGRQTGRRTTGPPPGHAQPKPAVAGASDAGPLSGAGFSEGPDNGAAILPVGYGHVVLAGTHTVTLVGKSKPLATVTGGPGWPSVTATRMTRPP